MQVSKLNLKDFAAGKESAQQQMPIVPKNFSFFGKQKVEEEPEFTKTQFSAKTQEFQKKGFEEGLQAGKDEVTKTVLSLEQNTKSAVENILSQLSKFLTQYEEEKKNYMRNMAKVTMIAIQKIAEKTIKENTEQVILQALEKASEVISKQPVIILKAKKIILEKIKDKVDNLLKGMEFKGNISYVDDETITDGAAIIEWGGSGVSINSNELLKQIEEVISEYLKSI